MENTCGHSHLCSDCGEPYTHEDIVFSNENVGLYICSKCSINYEETPNGGFQFRAELIKEGCSIPWLTINNIELIPVKILGVREQMESLRKYINCNLTKGKEDPYYNESFCNITGDYLGSKGEFSEDDVLFLKENEYSPSDFENSDDEDEDGATEFLIPVEWTVYGTVMVEAKTLEDAIEWAKNNSDEINLPDESSYMNGSFVINDDEDLIRQLNKK